MKRTLAITLCLIFAVGAFSQKLAHNTKKPVIGVSVTYTMKGTCTRAIENAGGIPVILAATTDSVMISEMLDMVDGLLMSGGVDVHPKYYGDTISAYCGEIDEERDVYEFLLLKEATRRKMPVFGVCRGIQIINVFMGGTLYQDLPTEKPSDINHSQTGNTLLLAHDVEILPDTELFEIVGKKRLSVNSRHHQAVKDVGPGMRVTAWSPDGIVEGLEFPPLQLLAVQWHPEDFAAKGDPDFLPFFTDLVARARRYALNHK